MTTLTKLQLALLTTGAARPDGSLLPAPVELGVAPNRVRKAAGQLIDSDFAEERQVTEQPASWRSDGEALVGAFITDTGRQQVAPAETVPLPSPSARPAKVKKTDLLVELLGAAEGASIEEVMTATDWQAHSARAAITTLKKKGHTVERLGNRGASRYRIAGAQ